jgi:hypothetical protein
MKISISLAGEPASKGNIKCVFKLKQKLTHFVIALSLLLMAACSGTKIISTDDDNKMEPLRIVITLKQNGDDDIVNRVMSVFTAVKSPDNMQVYHSKGAVSSTTLDYKWNEMRRKEIIKLKNFCEQLPEKITVEYQ